MVTAVLIHGSEGLEVQYKIRYQVFTLEQGVPIEIEQDEYDSVSQHVIIYDDNIAVGTGRIINKNGQWLIGRIAVLSDFRGRSYGDLIVRKLVDYGFRMGYKQIEVHSQIQVLDFYKRIGFIEYGEEYLESNIQHKSMYITEELFYKQCS